jgi:protocatechuate 3,4-dioxygenase alpha subunit
VSNGAGKAHLRTLLEFWQADANGYYAHPRDSRTRPNSSFTGFGRAETDHEGRYAFETIKPGSVPGPGGGLQAPHIVVAIHSPYLLTHLCSRIYFDDEGANTHDPILALVPADRRATLIARNDGKTYRMDFVTQGERETVFFDF